jgi:hypothetical protein
VFFFPFIHNKKPKKGKVGTQNTPANTKTKTQNAQGALVMPLMSRGFKRGTIKFVVLAATKPPRAA